MRFGKAQMKMAESNDISTAKMSTPNTSSDFNQWLHAMKMVARLPGGMPPEFRKKLWLALSERYLQTKEIDWEKEQAKCLCDQYRDDDEELGIQIVKDLHRTGSSLFSGPAGSLNQGKLKRVLLGYARWNPEVGYCQGFNMLGALILQVMDKNDIESLKVMIFLIEGILPPGYFCGSLGGLQVDMAVFREILLQRLPKLAKHLQRLQGPIGEASFEPPLTNVFTMQWFLTLFCTCLPINCVLRVWDLVLIEGSDVLLRTALAIWGLLEERILQTKTADDFYCKMGMLSGELLNGHLFDSNGLIQKVVDLGPISELQKMRDKQISNVTPWRDKKGVRLFFSDEEGDSDDDSRLAVTAAWGIRLGRRGSIGLSGPAAQARAPVPEKDRIALDIGLLKKQYDKLRERQRQAHIILTSSARQTVVDNNTSSSVPAVNQYLLGRNAIISNKGRRIGPPPGAIPPVRKVSVLKQSKSSPKQTKRGETLLWKDINATESTSKYKELGGSGESGKNSTSDENVVVLQKSPSCTSSLSSTSDNSSAHTSTNKVRKRSESSSYDEDSDGNSSTSTSLCDDDNLELSVSSIEASPLRKRNATESDVPVDELNATDLEECLTTLNNINVLVDEAENIDDKIEVFQSVVDHQNAIVECNYVEANPNAIEIDVENRQLEIVVKASEEIENVVDKCCEIKDNQSEVLKQDSENSLSENITKNNETMDTPQVPVNISIFSAENIKTLLGGNTFNDVSDSPADPPRLSQNTSSKNTIITGFPPLAVPITSTSQLSPIADISKYLSNCNISPLRTPASFLDYTDLPSTSTICNSKEAMTVDFKVHDEGVTNEYFERITAPERPSRLDLRHTVIAEDIQSETNDRENVMSTSGCGADSPSVVELPINIMSPESSILPPCTEITKIPPEKSPLIHHQQQFSSFGNSAFLREKSFSLDLPENKTEKFRPTSCPEPRSEDLMHYKQNDRVLKIIEENSQILHRILKKTLTEDSDYFSQELKKNSNLLRTDLESFSNSNHIQPEKSSSFTKYHLKEVSESDEKILIKEEDSIDKLPDEVHEKSEGKDFPPQLTDNVTMSNEKPPIEIVSDLQINNELYKFDEKDSFSLDKYDIHADHENSLQQNDSNDLSKTEIISNLDSQFEIHKFNKEDSSMLRYEKFDKENKDEQAESNEGEKSNNLTQNAVNVSEIYLEKDKKDSLDAQNETKKQEENFKNACEIETYAIQPPQWHKTEDEPDECQSANQKNDSKSTTKKEECDEIESYAAAWHNSSNEDECQSADLENKKADMKSDSFSLEKYQPVYDEDTILNGVKKEETCDKMDDDDIYTLHSPLPPIISKGNFSPDDGEFLSENYKILSRSVRKERLEMEKMDSSIFVESDGNSENSENKKTSGKYEQSKEIEKNCEKGEYVEKVEKDKTSEEGEKDYNQKEQNDDLSEKVDKSEKADGEKIYEQNVPLGKRDTILKEEKNPKSILNDDILMVKLKETISEALPDGEVPDIKSYLKEDWSHDLKTKISTTHSLEFDKRPLYTDTKDNRETSEESKDIIYDKMPAVSFPAAALNHNEGDISDTISSIQKTIESIDSLCQNDDSNKNYQTDEKESSRITPILQVDDTSRDPSTSSNTSYSSASCDTDRYFYHLPASRISRDKRRDISPRRKRDDDKEEYESRCSRRDSSAMSKSDIIIKDSDFKYLDRTSTNYSAGFRFSETSSGYTTDITSNSLLNAKQHNNSSYDIDDITKYDTNKFTSKYYNRTKDINLSLNIPLSSTKPPPQQTTSVHSKKLEIRHTTVTSTFYDRFLSQKKERNTKLDKSPSSPIITTEYLNSLRPPPSSYTPTSISDGGRYSRSAENSPSRLAYSNVDHSTTTTTTTASTTYSTTISPLQPLKTYSSTSVKSCDNIPDRIIIDKSSSDGKSSFSIYR